MEKEKTLEAVAKAVLKSRKLKTKVDYAVIKYGPYLNFIPYPGICLHENRSRAFNPSKKKSGSPFTIFDMDSVFLMHVHFRSLDISFKTSILFYLEKMYDAQF